MSIYSFSNGKQLDSANRWAMYLGTLAEADEKLDADELETIEESELFKYMTAVDAGILDTLGLLRFDPSFGADSVAWFSSWANL